MLNSYPRQYCPNVYALADCNRTSSFSGIAKKICWKIFFTYPHLLTGVGKGDTVDDVEK